MKRLVPYFLLIISYSLFISSCKKDSFITSPQAIVETNADSIKFDTVFTSVGSVTQSFKIFNLNDQKILLSKVKLMGGNTSSFRININGNPSSEVDNIEVDANDSIYVFVSVDINPNASNLSFIVSDSILINYNGNSEYVQLQAFGQNAHFLQDQIITTNTNWSDTLPYVILGSLRVDTTASLTIPAGCRVYTHSNAPILVDGTLIVNGTRADSVLFTGDRLDAGFADLPGSWPGIYFRSSSKDNVLTHAVLQNAFQAIIVDSPSGDANPKLILHQCVINNASNGGLVCINTNVNADNSLISNCANDLQISFGGTYNFTNCTVAGYGNSLVSHQNPVLQATNYSLVTNNNTNSLNAFFQNCIFWGGNGNVSSEVFVGKQGIDPFNVTLDHSLYKGTIDPTVTDTVAVIQNADPLFDLIDSHNMAYNFHTSDPSAPGIGKGATTSFPEDLDDSSRTTGGLTDIGAYQKQ